MDYGTSGIDGNASDRSLPTRQVSDTADNTNQQPQQEDRGYRTGDHRHSDQQKQQRNDGVDEYGQPITPTHNPTGDDDAEEDTGLLDHPEQQEPAEKNCLDRGLEWLLPPGSIPASAFNLCAATLGAGTLGLPYAMRHTGAAVGSVMLALCGAVTVYTCDLLILTLEKTGWNTYESLSRNLFNPCFEKAVAGLIVLFCWGVACVYVTVIGSIIKPLQVIEALPQGVWGDRLMTCIFWLCFMLPLSLLRDINSLRYASLIGFLATAYLVIAIIIFAATRDEHSKKTIDPFHEVDFDFWSSLTVFSFSYCCQTNAFEIYHELSQARPSRMKKAAALGMTCCTSMYIMSGVAGLASFGGGIESNILKNFLNPQDTPYILVAFMAITFTVTMAFPVAIFPTRDAVLQMIGYKSAYDTPTRVRILVCTLLAVSALALGLFVPNIKILFSILGGVCGSSLGYCLPVLFAWKAGVLNWDEDKPNFLLAWFVFAVGFVFGILGTITTVITEFQSSDASGTNSTSNVTTTTFTSSAAAPPIMQLVDHIVTAVAGMKP